LRVGFVCARGREPFLRGRSAGLVGPLSGLRTARRCVEGCGLRSRHGLQRRRVGGLRAGFCGLHLLRGGERRRGGLAFERGCPRRCRGGVRGVRGVGAGRGRGVGCVEASHVLVGGSAGGFVVGLGGGEGAAQLLLSVA
jgi:hypothetical protein